jgi:hypothetical protein
MGGEGDGQRGDTRKLYYVPLSVKLLQAGQGEECKIDGFEIKSVCPANIC